MLKLINTISKKKEEFIPLSKDKVTIYQCGPTVYSHQHIGNMESVVRGDLIRRGLIYLGYNVEFTRNITDVGHLVSDEDEGEDKMEKSAKREGLSPIEIANKYSEIFHNDLTKLNCLPPDNETKASEYIEEMANMVQVLLDKGFAYATSKAIYFDVTKFPNYNFLNGQNLKMNIQGLGHGSEEDTEKKHSFDFALWFFKIDSHKNALQTWEQRFVGIEQTTLAGFPGWHIECSAMSKATLGETIDIHIGGVEHIQVHHTNEIAQSESANGVKFVNYWLHHEMLDFDGGKMSKSKGNIYTLDDLINKGYDPLVLRYFFLQAHYRSKQNFTFEALDGAGTAEQRLIKLIKHLKFTTGGVILLEYKKKFIASLEDDINIPKALSFAWDVLKDTELEDNDKFATVNDFDRVFGLKINEKFYEKTDETSSSPEIVELIKAREKARNSKDWPKADRIRKELKVKYDYEVMDKK